jgi:hypothetical protein
MKIRLTESQYKRLLTEDDKSFLDGIVDFPNIGNKVDKLIAKIFITLKKQNITPNIDYLKLQHPLISSAFKKIYNEIKLFELFSDNEVILLTHNYSSVLWDDVVEATEKNDINILIGKELEFYGNFKYPIKVSQTGYISGDSDGYVSAYAKDSDDFVRRIEDGSVDGYDDPNSNIDFDSSYVDWEPNWDYTFEVLRDSDIDFDDIELDI